MWVKMLEEAFSSFLKPLKRVDDTRFEVSLENGETQRRFPMIMSYYCEISVATDMLASLHSTGRQHPCFRCHSTYENMVKGKESLSCVVAEKIETKQR